MYTQDVIDNLVLTLITSLRDQENSTHSPDNTEYDTGVLDGSHDTMIDVLDLLKVTHNFTHIS